MPYLSQIIGTPVFDSTGEKIGVVSDLGAAIGERFPRITALAFKGPAKVPFMISWRKYVQSLEDDRIVLNVDATEVRFSYLQKDELLLHRDLMNKQIVDTGGMKVVRVNDLKLSSTGDSQLHLLGAEVGTRGILRGIAPGLETVVCGAGKALGHPIPEKIIAWSYMDLLDRDISQVQLSVTHKSLEDMHPADIADIIEQLDPSLRTHVFSQLDPDDAADAVAELDDDVQADVIEDLPDRQASALIASMGPDDAADIIGALSYDKAEKLLNLMGVKEEKAIRQLLGYPRDTAGGTMTTEFVGMRQTSTVADARDRVASLEDDFEPTYYVYTLDDDRRLVGIVSMRDLLISDPQTRLCDIAFTDLITVKPLADQESVAEEMAKYSLVNIPVVDDDGKILGVVTADDALNVIDEARERDLELASGTRDSAVGDDRTSKLSWFLRRNLWFVIWILASAVMCHLIGGLWALLLACFLPIVLLIADDMTTFATNCVYDDEQPSLAGMCLRNILIGLVVGALGWLIASCALWTGAVPEPLDMPMMQAALTGSMLTVAILIALTAPYTHIMRKLIDADKPTPGTGVSVGLMCVAAVLFVALCTLCSVCLGVA